MHLDVCHRVGALYERVVGFRECEVESRVGGAGGDCECEFGVDAGAVGALCEGVKSEKKSVCDESGYMILESGEWLVCKDTLYWSFFDRTP